MKLEVAVLFEWYQYEVDIPIWAWDVEPVSDDIEDELDPDDIGDEQYHRKVDREMERRLGDES